MKVLVSAFSCCPGRGSEPGVGWNWVGQIASKHEVWLLTSDEFQEQIVGQLTSRIHATFIPSFSVWQKLRNLPIPGLEWVYYYWWQCKAYRVAMRLHQQHEFDLAHHVTLASWRAPSFLCLLGIPFIWGPVGGGEDLPRAFWKELGWKGRVHETIRQAVQWASRWDPFVRLTVKRAARILVGNRDTAAILPRYALEKIGHMSNAGISAGDFVSTTEAGNHDGRFQVLFAGMLEPRKGIPLLLRGFAILAEACPDAKLCIAGGGPELPRIMSLAEELGITPKIEFTGWLQREALLKRMDAADVFVLPSLRDSAGIVLLEAMLAQKPVICLNLGGPGEIVKEETGIKIEAHTPEQASRAMGDALIRLADDPLLRRRLGIAGRTRVLETFDWDKKGATMLSIYDELLHKTSGRPPRNSVT